MLESAGHLVVADAPDVVLCDLARDAVRPAETEAPVVMLARRRHGGPTGRRIAARRDTGPARCRPARGCRGLARALARRAAVRRVPRRR